MSSNETMREKVAKAICAAADDDWNHPDLYMVDANDTPESCREIYLEQADAALAAMGVTGETGCQHEWVDASNRYVSNASMCLKCKLLAPTNTLPAASEAKP